MKIGTITFHWATNYGAVLQAFALQKYLIISGYDTEIINYIPFKVKVREILNNIKNVNIEYFKKEYKISNFRKRYLIVSNKKYYTNKKLLNKCHDYDIYICGSDQVWNEWFIMNSENKYNLSYYLNFVKNGKKRVSYATSFGTDKLLNNVKELIKNELDKFLYISVREKSGQNIMKNMNIDSTLVVDPTLLLKKEDYEVIIKDVKRNNINEMFSYILHDNQVLANQINNYIRKKHFSSLPNKYNEIMGIQEWLYNIKYSKFIVTNSFHGVVFSVIFNKPFIVIPVEGSKMNDRIKTLLNLLDLENRIIDNFDKVNIDYLVTDNIEWNTVNNLVCKLRKNSIKFIDKFLY